MDLVTELHKNLSFPVLGFFLTEDFSCKNYTKVASVVTARLNFCERDSLEACFI